MLTSEDDKRVSGGEVARCEVTVGYQVLLLSQSLGDLGITRGECLGRTRWSSPLDWTTYLYYFYKWLYTTSPQSYVLLECSTITWPCHVIWLLKFPCYLYLVFIIWLDVCDQVFECIGNFFLLRALITHKLDVTNFIQPYLHQFSIDSHGLNGYGKPLKRPFDQYQSRLEVISDGRDIRQINW